MNTKRKNDLHVVSECAKICEGGIVEGGTFQSFTSLWPDNDYNQLDEKIIRKKIIRNQQHQQHGIF